MNPAQEIDYAYHADKCAAVICPNATAVLER